MRNRLLSIWLCLSLLAAPAMASPVAYTVPLSAQSTTIGLTLPGIRPRQIELDAPTLFHTITTDFLLQDDGTMYVQSGDIPAMWLRDSSAQTYPYLRFINSYQQLDYVTHGVIERNARNILVDSYANAFTAGYKVWEEKWEVDSLAYASTLLTGYWQLTHDRAILTPRLRWSIVHIIENYECEQQHRTCSHYRSRFLTNHGSGAAYDDTGMIWGAFRPSDDAVRYPFNIPQELFAAHALNALARFIDDVYGDSALAFRARELAAAVLWGVDRFGRMYDFRFGWIYAYEVDGKGGAALMDDANLPDLVALSLFQLTAGDDPLYQNTRRFSLSTANPYYYRGRYAAGLGSPHTPTGWVWPLALAATGITASTVNEVVESLEQLRAIDGEKGLLFESVDPNRPWHFTRSSFGWANAMYAELVFRSVADLHQVPAETDEFALLPSLIHTPHITAPMEKWRAAATIYSALTRILRD